jgi:hypothetical protein
LHSSRAEIRVAAITQIALKLSIVGMVAIGMSTRVLAPLTTAHEDRGTSTFTTVIPSSTERPLPYAQPDDPNAPGIDDESTTDLYGNDVTAAVARYKLDSTGSLYEAHSPQTQLAKLGSPKS